MTSSANTLKNCAFPGCERPVRPKAGEGGGKPPIYCDLSGTLPGKYAHTSLTAARELARLEKGAKASQPGVVLVPQAPASAARSRAQSLLEQFHAEVGQMSATLQAAVEAMTSASDPQSVSVELTAARHQVERSRLETAEQVAAAEAARDQALVGAEAARAEAGEAKTAREEAIFELEATEATLGELRQELEQVRAGHVSELQRLRGAHADELRRLRTEAEQQVTVARTEASEQVVAAEQRAVEQIHTAQSEAAGRVQAAEAARSQAATEASAARQAATDATHRADEARDELRQARAEHRDELGALRSDYREELAAEVQRLRAEHAGVLDRLRSDHVERVQTAEAARDQATTEHRDELAALRQEHRGELAAERQRAEQLRTDLATLTAQLDAARNHLQTEKTHAADRIADHRDRASTAEHETQRLREQLDQLRAAAQPGPAEENAHQKGDTHE